MSVFISSSHQDKKRLLCIALFFLVLMSALVGKFFLIQIADREYWQKKADRQHFIHVQDFSKRGKFTVKTTADRLHPSRESVLTLDLRQYCLHTDSQNIPAALKETVATELVALLPALEFKQLMNDLLISSRNRRLATEISPLDRKAIENWWFPFAKKHKLARNVLFFVPDWKRSYPFGTFFAQGLHTLQKVKEEITQRAIPTGGLEHYFDKWLQGIHGKRRLMRSPLHSFESGTVLKKAQDGQTVELTIEPFLQAIAEEEIKKGVIRSKAKGGWVVMMNPFSGEILAMAQYPYVDLDHFSKYYGNPQFMEQTRLKATNEAHEPGSVMKPITLAIALLANEVLHEQGKPLVFSPSEKVATSNGKFPGRTKLLLDTHSHSFLNMYMAIQKSSNIYVGRIIGRVLDALGNLWYREQLEKVFGFGVPSGVEYPGENPGVVPKPGKKHPNGKLEWSLATPYSLAMGHNIQANSIQLVRAYAIFANGGYLVQPTLLRKIEGEELSDNHIKRRVLPTNIVEEIVKGMRYVSKPGGSGFRADIPGYTEAVKSSTAKKIKNGEYSEREYLSSMIGFAPVSQPAFVLQVSIDEPEYGFIPGYGRNHHGGNCAANVFRRIGQRALNYLNVEPEDPGGYPVGDPRRDLSKMIWHQETLLLQENYEKWNKINHH